MLEKLKDLRELAYAPYSKFRVAAIAVMKDGTEFSGVNVENASFGATICAERVAITSAIAAGYKKHDFESLYLLCDGDSISTPCFLCRQVIQELFEVDKLVIMMNNSGDVMEKEVGTLCPLPFDSEDLR